MQPSWSIFNSPICNRAQHKIFFCLALRKIDVQPLGLTSVDSLTAGKGTFPPWSFSPPETTMASGPVGSTGLCPAQPHVARTASLLCMGKDTSSHCHSPPRCIAVSWAPSEPPSFCPATCTPWGFAGHICLCATQWASGMGTKRFPKGW